MSREIEEMAKHCAHRRNGLCQGESECDLMCSMFGTFAKLEMAGYRKQRVGQWIAVPNTTTSASGREIHSNLYVCSLCGRSNGRRKQKFCPNCGAQMKGDYEQ